MFVDMQEYECHGKESHWAASVGTLAVSMQVGAKFQSLAGLVLDKKYFALKH